MIYKFLITSLLFTPLINNAKNIDIQIRELKNERMNKMQTLSNLAEAITQKDKLVRCIPQEMNLLLSRLALEKKLNNEDPEQCEKAIISKVENFTKTLDERIFTKKNVKHFFIRELFTKIDAQREDFDILKFSAIRYFFEQTHLKALVEQYEEHRQELIEIDEKLAELQQQ